MFEIARQSGANRVTTPILIMHGDLDPQGIEQSEMYFSVLNRLGKTAEFVRYVGEEHGIESPFNILDFWSRIFGWFDKYVRGTVH